MAGNNMDDASKFVFGNGLDNFDNNAILATSCEAVKIWNSEIEKRRAHLADTKTCPSHNSVNDDFAFAEDFNSSDCMSLRWPSTTSVI
eukprot:gene4345-5346_t